MSIWETTKEKSTHGINLEKLVEFLAKLKLRTNMYHKGRRDLRRDVQISLALSLCPVRRVFIGTKSQRKPEQQEQNKLSLTRSQSSDQQSCVRRQFVFAESKAGRERTGCYFWSTIIFANYFANGWFADLC